MIEQDTVATRVQVDGRPFWAWEDGTLLPVISGGADDGEPDPKPDPAPEPDPEPDPDPKPDPTGTDDPVVLRKELERARKDAAKYRTQARDAQTKQTNTDTQMAAIAKALGLDDGTASTDPDALQAELTKRDSEIRRLRVTNALSDTFARHGAKPKLTRAILADDGILDELDPDDTDFTATLDAAVKKAVDTHPELKAGQAPTRSSGDFNGANGGKPQLTREDLKTMTAAQIVEAKTEGRLDLLLGRA